MIVLLANRYTVEAYSSNLWKLELTGVNFSKFVESLNASELRDLREAMKVLPKQDSIHLGHANFNPIDDHVKFETD